MGGRPKKDEECIQDFGTKTQRKNHFENLKIDGRIIVKVLMVSTLSLCCPIQEESNFQKDKTTWKTYA